MLLNTNGMSLENQASNLISIGIDQGNTSWVMTAFDRRTGKKSRYNYRGFNKEFDCYKQVTELVNTGKEISVCYEAGRSGFTPARYFKYIGCKHIRILPYNKIKILSTGKTPKTDKIDSEFLSEINPLDKEIPSVWIPDPKQECLRELPREEQRLKRDISRNNNRIISILQRWPVSNINTHMKSSEWRKHFNELEKNGLIPKLLPSSELKRIKMMVDELELLERNMAEWCEFMREEEKKEQEKQRNFGRESVIDILREYRGIGEVIARTFAWEIGDFKRFQNAKKFTSYLGLTPTHYASGKMFREQGISKQGNPELRRLAIQLAWLWRHWQPDSRISKKWNEQLSKPGRQRKTAIVAMGRSLMVAIFRRIVHGEEIEGAVKNKPIGKK